MSYEIHEDPLDEPMINPVADPTPEDILFGNPEEIGLGWEEFGDYTEPIEDGGGWGDIGIPNPPLVIGDTFLFLLDEALSKERPHVFKAGLVEIRTDDMTAHFQDTREKFLVFAISETSDAELPEYTLVLTTPNYRVLDLAKVEPYEEPDDESSDTEMEIEVEEVSDKVFTDVSQTEDVLSRLIQSLGIYDQPYRILETQEVANTLLRLSKEPHPVSSDSVKVGDYIVPITSDSLVLHEGPEGSETILPEIQENNLVGFASYQEMLAKTLRKPVFVTEGYYQTDRYSGTYLRDCLQTTSCTGYGSSSYAYDERRNDSGIVIPVFKMDDAKQPYTEFERVAMSTEVSFSGYLQEPYNRMMYSLKPTVVKQFDLVEKCHLYEVFAKTKMYRKQAMGKESLVYQGTIDETDVGSQFVVRQFASRIDERGYREYLNTHLPKPSEIVASLEKRSDLMFLNIRDFEKTLTKYGVSYALLDQEVRGIVTRLIQLQVEEYTKQRPSVPKVKATKKSNVREISVVQKIHLAKKYILQIIQDSERNALLKEFMEAFAREPNSLFEDPHWFYNKYTNEKLLCHHYKYQVEMKNDNNVFETMRSLYGSPPEDGEIRCKVCGEYLCPEDYSVIDGFDEGQPITSSIDMDKEFSQGDDAMNEYLETHEVQANRLRLLVSSLGLDMEDSLTYEILKIASDFSQSELADTRYGMSKVGESDGHPRIQALVAEIKAKEKKAKDKREKSKLKKQRETAILDFRKFLKESSTILMYLAISSICIQTSVPPLSLKKNREYCVFDREKNEFRQKTIEYIEVKLKKVCEAGVQDPFWKAGLQLYNEPTGVNTLGNQLKNTILYCLSPRFPEITKRVQNHEKYLKANTSRYLKPEWVTFKPLQMNSLNQGISEILKGDGYQSQLLRNYSGVLIENSSFFRLVNESFRGDASVAKICKIPQIEILRNKSFQSIFRLVVSCYGTHPNSVYFTILILRLLETATKSSEIQAILKRHGWKEGSKGFPNLDFKTWRTKIVPEIFGSYKEPGGELKSCFDNESSCNAYIHANINNYDLSLLNTQPKRIYGYNPPNVFPDTSFAQLTKDNPSLVKKLFERYRYNLVGEIIRYNGAADYCDQFKVRLGEKIADDLYEADTLKKLSENEDGFRELLEHKRLLGSLSYKGFHPITKTYDAKGYETLAKVRETQDHFVEWLRDFPDYIFDEYTEINQELLSLLESHEDTSLKDTVWSQRYKEGFSQVVSLQAGYLGDISEFLMQSDAIDSKQRGRFSKTMGIKYTSDNLSKVLSVSVNEMDFAIIQNYLGDIRRILVKVSTRGDGTDLCKGIPKEWRVTETIQKNFASFMVRKLYDDSSVINGLMLHDKFMRPLLKDPYQGFRTYSTISENSHLIFEGLFRYLKPLLTHTEKLMGQVNSPFSPKLSVLYARFHLVHVIRLIITYIRELKDRQSEVTKDANLLFIALDEVNEDMIEVSVEILSKFVCDLVTHLMMAHYDTDWLHMNRGDKLGKGLAKQKEREKQKRIQELDSASGSEERELMRAKQEYGMTNWWKEASDASEALVQSEGFQQLAEAERLEMLQQIYTDRGLDVEEIPVAILGQQREPDEVGEEGHDYDEDTESEDEDGGDDDMDAEYNE